MAVTTFRLHLSYKEEIFENPISCYRKTFDLEAYFESTKDFCQMTKTDTSTNR